MKRPTIKSPCVADRYAAAGERIAEFTTPSGKGGLFRVMEKPDGEVVAEVYRCDGVTVLAPQPHADSPNDTVDALIQAESFIAGFEGDELQSGDGMISIPDLLAGLRLAINREHAKPVLLDALKLAKERLEISNCEGEEDTFLASIDEAIAAAGKPHSLAANFENVRAYDRAMTAGEIAPNGDDYNAIFDMMNGAEFRAPHTTGR